MITDDQIKNKKIRYDINIKVTIIKALSSNKIDKYEYFTDEEILPSNNRTSSK